MNGIIYNFFLHTLVAPFLAAYYLPRVILGRKYRRSFHGKLGRLPADFCTDTLPRPRLWFHAVSVGEVVALSPLVKSLKEVLPEAAFIVSTGTETGQDMAHDLIPEADGFLYLPLDFPAFLNPVVERIEPDLFVLMETEIWPNLISTLKRRGTLVAMANGRISDRSFPRYRRLRAFFSSTLQKIDLFLMSSMQDAARVREMGAPENRISVTGNTKFDAVLRDVPEETEERMRALLDIGRGTQTVVAGSTHPGETEMVLSAYETLLRSFPDLVLILAPRHVEKTPQILSTMAERKMKPPLLRSAVDRGEKRDGRQVIIVDVTGELFQVFSLASVVFMGGSLVPKGGQNILEPAAWGKVVLFGPSMEDFRDARDILVNTGAGIEVRSLKELTRRMAEFLTDEEEASCLGKLGQQEVLRHLGSARKNAEMLAGLLAGKGEGRGATAVCG
ncbi:MAG: 3-deoxy-D-manno-octulosonic acid transferase [Deltaproteobacteria bacterium]